MDSTTPALLPAHRDQACRLASDILHLTFISRCFHLYANVRGKVATILTLREVLDALTPPESLMSALKLSNLNHHGL